MSDRSSMDLKFMEPQSRFVMRSLFKRHFDAFTGQGKRLTNWAMLLWDIVIVIILWKLL